MQKEVEPLIDYQSISTAGSRSILREAWQLERAICRALGGYRHLSVWLLLDALNELVCETGDAVSQVQLARRTGLSERAVSYQMGWMYEHGFVDREPALDGRAYRLYLSRDGKSMLRIYIDRLRAADLINSVATRK